MRSEVAGKAKRPTQGMFLARESNARQASRIIRPLHLTVASGIHQV